MITKWFIKSNQKVDLENSKTTKCFVEDNEMDFKWLIKGNQTIYKRESKDF